MAVKRAFSNATVGCSGQACVGRVAREVLKAKFRPDIFKVVLIYFCHKFQWLVPKSESIGLLHSGNAEEISVKAAENSHMPRAYGSFGNMLTIWAVSSAVDRCA